jgi:hypothetical protein
LNVIVPLGLAPPPESVALIELAGIGVLVFPLAGPETVAEVEYCTVAVLVNPEVAVQDEWYFAVILYS